MMPVGPSDVHSCLHQVNLAFGVPKLYFGRESRAFALRIFQNLTALRLRRIEGVVCNMSSGEDF